MSQKNPIVSAIKDLVYHGMETFGRYYSIYRAFVFDNNDPLFSHRLKLIIPEVGGNTPYNYWASPKGIYSGDGYGVQMIPQKGDIVWVQFERGHPEVPVYSLGYRGFNEIPDDPDFKDVNCFWFKTPYGHTVKLNDTKKSIIIETNGAKIELDENGLVNISNSNTNLKTLLINIMKTYMKTTTVSGGPITAGSVNNAAENIKEINKLLS